MYEINLDPKDYGIEALVEGMGNTPVPFKEEDRQKWAHEIGAFAGKLDELSDKAKSLQTLFSGDTAIKATPASLKTFKIQMFNINDAVSSSLELAGKIDSQIIQK
jgi:hypothetical protein